jgi:uncharacterized protein
VGGELPSIWVLSGARVGDTAQALELARRVGGRIEEKQLTFNALHHVPNVLKPLGLQSLTTESRNFIAQPWPDLVIATGKRTAPIACAIKVRSEGKSNLVQLGRPRMALRHFDLVITTPQYGLPGAENVITLPTPFAAPRPVDGDVRKHWTETWHHLPRPWIMAVIGASKFPLRLGGNELDGFALALNAAARAKNAGVILFDSPRSISGALTRVTSRLTVPHWTPGHHSHGGAYQSALASADYFAVTGDSVSMATEMLATGKPTAVFRLPRRPSLRWTAANGVGAAFARSGVLSPPRDVDGFMTAQISNHSLGVLGQSWGETSGSSGAHDAAVQRVKRLVGLS